nr:sigma-70 family RNA polymerase sigma factor [uncultured Prevotella sp.]
MTVDEYKQEVKRTRPQLLFIARKYMGSEEEAEDVVQDVLLKLWQICDTLRIPIDGFATILVRNHCVDLLRRRPKSQDINENFTDESREDDERIEKMMKIIDRLPTLQQTLIRLRHMENMEMKDIAALVGSNEVAVRKALSRARQAIRNKYLNDKEHE